MRSQKLIDKQKINKLVVEGCAGRFIAVVGGIQALEKAGVWKNIREISASSSGAFIALFGALDMSVDEMYAVASNMDENTCASKTRRSQIPFFGPKLSVLSKFGINRTDGAVRFAKKILEDHHLSPNLTFKELADLIKIRPELRNIHINALNISKSPAELTVFSSENEFTQHVKIADAFAAAVAYPALLIPMKILINGKEYQFIDGGAKDPYPYCIFPQEEWPHCVGLKLDTGPEVWECEDHEPGLFDTFYWALHTDNDFIYKRAFPNSIQIFDCRISSFTSPTLIDYKALSISGELATTARLEGTFPEEKKEICADDPSIRARTDRYRKMLAEDGSISQYIFPIYYLNLLMIYQEIKAWDDKQLGCCAYYNALLQQLNQWRCWSLSDFLVTGSALRKAQVDLYQLLFERREDAALLPDATPNLITDLTLSYLQKKEYGKAYALLSEIEKQPNAEKKLLHINHRKILQLLHQSGSALFAKESLTQLVIGYQEKLFQTYPGAYEGYLITEFGALLKAKKYLEATIIAEKLLATPTLTDQHRQKIFDAAMQLFGETSEQGLQLKQMFPVMPSLRTRVMNG